MTQDRTNPYEIILDEDALRVSRVYAEALLNLAEKRGQAESLLQELEELVGTEAASDPRFEEFLQSPDFGRREREAVLKRAFEGRASDLLLDFLLVLNHHDRLPLLRAATRSYRQLFDRRTGRIPVQVASATPLADDQVEQIRQKLRGAFQREPVLQLRVDPDLLGGVVVRVRDWIYDGSLRTSLLNLHDQLIENSKHELQNGRDRFYSPVGN
jgi:F-type H+-transporting ATPase subunit delta